jgi:hypothetical protein
MEKAKVQASVGTYSVSWIDRIVGVIDRLPVHAWIFYAITLVGSVLLNNAVFWIDGGVRFGSFDPDVSIFALYFLYWLALYHHIGRQANQALRRFRPLLGTNDSEFERINFKLVNLPRNIGLVALLLGAVVATPRTAGNLIVTVGPIANSVRTSLPAVYFTLGTVFTGATFFAFLLRTVRQLQLVDRLHEQADEIDLLELDAAHAFSGLTARTGLGFILLLMILILPAPWETGAAELITALDIFFYFLIALSAAAVFVIPLEGMHRRLEAEKDSALNEFEELYRSTQERLYHDIKNSRYEEMGRTKEALSALMIHRERLDKTSTWPWNPRTIRGFGSALLVPIILILVGQLLERLL